MAEQVKSERWPNFIIPGAGKSGTSSIARYLSQHPDIFISNPKEPTFFTYAESPVVFSSPDKFHEQIVYDVSEYKSLFSNAEQCKEIGEASTYYLALPEQTIKNIKRFVPDYESMKIIIILRNPIDRAFSNYMMFNMNGWDAIGFREAISDETIRTRLANGWSPSYDYLEEGIYSEKVRLFLEAFNDVRIYLYEDLQRRPEWLLADIFSFLGVDSSFVPDFSLKINASGKPKVQWIQDLLRTDNFVRRSVRSLLKCFLPAQKRAQVMEKLRHANLKKMSMNHEDRSYLACYYKSDIEKLKTIIGRSLHEWK